MQKQHRILLVGSGMMAKAVLEILSKYDDSKITVASNIIEQAEELARIYPKCTEAAYVDIFNVVQHDQLCSLVAKNDYVISYIPPAFHMKVINACLQESKHLISSSYISDAILATDAEWKKKGLICLKECGLDPGIDIMSTIKVRDDAKKEGVRIVGYESWCGGMPAAEHTDNPLGYKFSWNPGASIKASKNTATYRKNGKVVVQNSPLKDVEMKDDFSVCFKLESYPNRDSLVFQERFNMQECRNFIRGTLRFKGFAYIIEAFHDIGLTAEKPVPEGITNLKELTESVLKGTSASNASAYAKNAIQKVMVGASKAQEDLALRFLSKVSFDHIADAQKQEACEIIIQGMRFLDFFNAANVKIQAKDNKGNQRFYLHAFGEHLAQKMELKKTDRDLVIMRHVFTMEKDGREWEKTSTMIGVGAAASENGFSFMAQTVGFTTALAVRLVVEGKIQRRGVLSPIYKEIYEPVLEGLEKLGIKCVEEDARIAPETPRL